MLKKNSTKLLFATKVCSRRPPKPEMTLIAKGVFTLRPGQPLAFFDDIRAPKPSLSADVFPDDDEERKGESLYPSDFADYKLNAEALLRGSCFTPNGDKLTECGVKFVVGAWSKTLRVIGERAWLDNPVGRAFTEPRPFNRMPLTFANAFGGPTFEKNPVGAGHETPFLPTVELAGNLVRSRRDTPEPASFGPINPQWPQRASKVGKAYGKKYMEERAPYYAEDFDWTYFQSGPADQQLKGYLHGDEEIAFHNLHAASAVFSARLPGIRVRAFVKDDAPRFREVPMVLDTLFADLEAGLLHLVWRGIDGVRESDLADVKAVMVVTERLGDEPKAAEAYELELSDFEKDPVGIEQTKKEMLDLHDAYAGEDAPSADLIKAALAPGATRASIAKVAVDRPQVSKQAAAEFERAAAEPGDEAPPVPLVKKPGALPSIGLRKQVRNAMAKFEGPLKDVSGKDVPPATREKLEEIAKLPGDPRWKEMDPDYTPPFPLSTHEPGPRRDLRDRDFTGQDLRGIDLTDADLDGAILTKARLGGATMKGARLRGAVLFKADLTGADLTGADLTRANAAKADFTSANLTGANVEQTFFEDAVLEQAKLVDVVGQYTAFVRADVSRADFRGATLYRADFEEAKLDGADLAGAQLPGCVFQSASLKKTSLRGAAITAASFQKADLTGAILAGAIGERAFFVEANLASADLERAVLRLCHFTDASAARAKMKNADLRESRFYRTRLDEADMTGANLFRADLCKASLTRTKLVDASLYDAKLIGASGEDTDLRGANLRRSTLERA